MTQAVRCPRCGATLPPGRADCPACLVQLGLEAERASDADDESPSRARERRRAPPPTPSELAADFPQLEILEIVGEGGMGVVYRARHKQLERELALKILASELAADARFEERFVREARALAKLDHPGIVHVHDFGRAGTRWFLLMEFVDGTNLRSLMKEHKLAARDALAIVPQICEALQYAHDEGVVHHDIKPENVLIDAKGRVKLVDFGLAKLVGAEHEPRHTATGTVVGTAHYIAPEQIARPREVDHRADIYSLGVVFYEMLTGELPLGRFEPPSKRVQVDVRLDEIVLKSLERAPERRYQHAVEVKTDVDELATGPAPVAPKEARASKPKRVRDRESSLDVLLFTLAWIVIGIAFNFGVVAFYAASLLLLLIAVRAQWRAAQRGEVRWTPVRKLIAIALFPVGFAFFFAGMVAFADRDMRDYDSGFVDVRHAFTNGLEPIADKLDQVAGGKVFTPTVVVAGEAITRRVLTELDAVKFWRNRWWLLVGLAVWFSALSLPSWKTGWYLLVVDGAPALRALFCACGPLFVLIFALRVVSGSSVGRASSVARPMVNEPVEVALSSEDAAWRVRLALIEHDFQVHTEVWERLAVKRDAGAVGVDVTGVRVLYADARDEFRRLRVTWRGLERALPTVTVFLIERDGAPLLAVTSLGRIYDGTAIRPGGEWFAASLSVTPKLREP